MTSFLLMERVLFICVVKFLVMRELTHSQKWLLYFDEESFLVWLIAVSGMFSRKLFLVLLKSHMNLTLTKLFEYERDNFYERLLWFVLKPR